MFSYHGIFIEIDDASLEKKVFVVYVTFIPLKLIVRQGTVLLDGNVPEMYLIMECSDC